MPYEPVTIGLKFPRFTVAPHVLHERYHPLKRLVDVENDLTCKSCKADEDLKWHIVRAKGPEWPRSA